MITKVIITGYIDLDKDEENYILSDLERITRTMTTGSGIMTNLHTEILKKQDKLEQLPEEIQDFFEYMFQEE